LGSQRKANPRRETRAVASQTTDFYRPKASVARIPRRRKRLRQKSGEARERCIAVKFKRPESLGSEELNYGVLLCFAYEPLESLV